MRGLKQDQLDASFVKVESHPLRVRGLKPPDPKVGDIEALVASFTGAWIETLNINKSSTGSRSHPLRVRGLKPLHWSNTVD